LVSCEEVPEETSFVLGGCQSLVFINNKLVGDPMETATLKALNWKFTQSNGTIDLLVTIIGDSVSGKHRSLRIVHRYHFSSTLKRMSTISVTDDNRTLVLSKGAPEKMREFMDLNKVSPILIPSNAHYQLPSHYESVYKSYARKGARVIALAYKQISNSTSDVLKKIPREEAEKDLLFAGFLIFECPLKPDSAQAISMLRHSSHDVSTRKYFIVTPMGRLL
jgi:cation-transporting ATPase 13A1